jgi:cobyrinic acid a,c-diamide synthase
LVVAGLSGDSGKTLVSLGLARALVDRGVKVRPFKKGPDYIDTAWLGVAARSTCRNLDTFLMKDEAMASSLATAASDADIILVEGNRGLFDGVDVEGSHSTAMLARRLAAPVVLVLDCTKMTRTGAMTRCRVGTWGWSLRWSITLQRNRLSERPMLSGPESTSIACWRSHSGLPSSS